MRAISHVSWYGMGSIGGSGIGHHKRNRFSGCLLLTACTAVILRWCWHIHSLRYYAKRTHPTGWYGRHDVFAAGARARVKHLDHTHDKTKEVFACLLGRITRTRQPSRRELHSLRNYLSILLASSSFGLCVSGQEIGPGP